MLLHPGRVPSSLVSNLNPQPYPGPDLLRWAANFAAGGAGVASYQTGGVLGLPFYRMTWTTASTEVNRGAERVGTVGMISEGKTYTVSGYARVGRTQSLYISALTTGTNGAGIEQYTGTVSSLPANNWAWFSRTFTAPVGSVGVSIRVYSNAASGGSNWAVGDTLDVTGLTLIEGASPVAYFDGNTPGASWAGAVGNSVSTTRAIQGVIPVGRLAEMGTLLHSQGVAVSTVPTPRAIPLNSPVTLYAAFPTGTTNHRANFLVGTVAHLGIGRNSAGTGWFALGANSGGGSAVATVIRAASPNVLSAVREQNIITAHSFAGNAAAGTSASWPASTSAALFNASTDVRHTEVWGAAHLPDIRYARMAQIRTTYGIAA